MTRSDLSAGTEAPPQAERAPARASPLLSRFHPGLGGVAAIFGFLFLGLSVPTASMSMAGTGVIFAIMAAGIRAAQARRFKVAAFSAGFIFFLVAVLAFILGVPLDPTILFLAGAVCMAAGILQDLRSVKHDVASDKVPGVRENDGRAQARGGGGLCREVASGPWSHARAARGLRALAEGEVRP